MVSLHVLTYVYMYMYMVINEQKYMYSVILEFDHVPVHLRNYTCTCKHVSKCINCTVCVHVHVQCMMIPSTLLSLIYLKGNNYPAVLYPTGSQDIEGSDAHSGPEDDTSSDLPDITPTSVEAMSPLSSIPLNGN